MRVLHFGRFFNEQLGGTERHVDELLSLLKDHIHVDNLVAAGGWHSDHLAPHGYDVYRARSLGLVASTALCPTMPFWARRLHRRQPYDIVHLHLPDPMAHLAFAALPRGPKLVLSWHSDIIRQQRALKIYRPLLDRLVARADAVIGATPRHYSASTQLQSCPPEKFHVIPYGLDYERYGPALHQAAAARLRACHGGGPLIFALGRHVYYKGFEYLVQALARMPAGRLLLGGSGPLTASLRELAARLGVADRVEFLGYIADADLPAYYQAADVFCLPSIAPSEAFGLVQLEAMACGKPVVCCELGNGVTWVNRHGETGLVVPPRDPAALAAALSRLLDDPALCRTLGETGRRRAREEFSVQAMAQKTLDLYRSLLA